MESKIDRTPCSPVMSTSILQHLRRAVVQHERLLWAERCCVRDRAVWYEWLGMGDCTPTCAALTPIRSESSHRNAPHIETRLHEDELFHNKNAPYMQSNSRGISKKGRYRREYRPRSCSSQQRLGDWRYSELGLFLRPR